MPHQLSGQFFGFCDLIFQARHAVNDVSLVATSHYHTMHRAALLVTFLTAAAVYGCGDHDSLIRARRDLSSVPLTPPSAPLEWGDVNFLHTTDTHGWLLGHQKTTFPEPNYR